MRRSGRGYVLACLGLACLAGSARAQGGSTADTAAGLRKSWVEALQQGDLEASVALYAPEALFVTPDGARYPDRAAIRTLYRSVMATYRSQISLSSVRVQASDTLLVDDGTYSETLTESATGKKLPLKGSYVLVWRRQADGSWKITDMVWTRS